MNWNLIDLLFIIVAGVGLLSAWVLYLMIRAYPTGEGKQVGVAEQIRIGAMAFMRREYSVMAVFVLVVWGLLAFFLGFSTSQAFLVGAGTSALAGFLGMFTATKANVRTANAAATKGMGDALSVAFYGGSVMGLCVASLGLLGLSVLYYLYGSDPETAHAIHGFGMGASSVALFSRVGGGIFTKCADVGADLVGKIEAGIPEDDPRNPGVIADNVGDNVGDVAGMGSDIFESYCGAIIATIAIATTMTPAALVLLSDGEDFERAALMALPLALAAAGLLSSIVSIALVRLSTHVGQPPSAALRIGTIASTVIVMAMAYLLIQTTFDIHINVWFTVIVGAVGGILIGLSTEYYTSSHPVRRIAESGETGSATVIITGLAIGFKSVVPAVLVIAGVIFLSTWLAGLYGVAIAAVGMLSTVGMTMAIDAYGPIADNAGGIAEMSGMGKETRKITDSLDALGNTTAAIGKGFAISAAALAALAIIAAFVEVLRLKYPGFTIDIANPDVLVGLFLGGVIPFFLASSTIKAVGDAAFDMIREIRRQFREIDGLLEGKAEPDTARCVDIATRAALIRMIIPGVVAVSAPPLVGLIISPEALGGMLGGALLCCVLLALMMANVGGAWDNAKKYVEQGHVGGRGSPAHNATIVGDTTGDPLKDTSGPAMNILINVMAIVSLVIAPLL